MVFAKYTVYNKVNILPVSFYYSIKIQECKTYIVINLCMLNNQYQDLRMQNIHSNKPVHVKKSVTR